MAYTLIASTSKGLGGTGGATDPIDTSGANLIIVWVTWFNAIRDPDPPSDNKGNTPYSSVVYNAGTVNYAGQMWMFLNPIVGGGHTFTSVSGGNTFHSISVLAFVGGAAPAENTAQGGVGTGTSVQALTSLTPLTNNALVVSGLMTAASAEDANVDSGFTKEIALQGSAGVFLSNFLAYKLEPTPASENPTWTWTTSGSALVANAVFPGAGVSSALPFIGSTLSQRA